MLQSVKMLFLVQPGALERHGCRSSRHRNTDVRWRV